MFIALSTIGFSLIQFVFDDSLDNIEKDYANITRQQGATMDWLLKAHSSISDAKMLRDHMVLLKESSNDTVYIKKREGEIIEYCRFAVEFAINANTAVELETKKVEEISVIDSIDDLISIYLTLAEKASQETQKLGRKQDNLSEKLAQKTKLKSIFWYSSMVFQSFGLLLGIILVSKKG